AGDGIGEDVGAGAFFGEDGAGGAEGGHAGDVGESKGDFVHAEPAAQEYVVAEARGVVVGEPGAERVVAEAAFQPEAHAAQDGGEVAGDELGRTGAGDI